MRKFPDLTLLYDVVMQNVAVPKALVAYRSQDSDFDDLMNVPIRRFTSLDDLAFDLSAPARYVVVDPQYSLPLDVLFYPRDSSTLLVGFHGAENRAAADFPKFQFVRSFLTRKESLLFISDSTLLQGSKINIGWLAGNKETPLAALMSEVVRRAGKTLGVERTILAGHSAGGYSAILVGSQVPNSRAISVSGQSVVERYEPWTVANLHREAFPECSSVNEMVERFSHRLDLRVALTKRLATASFTYFGNVRDKSTFDTLPHFPLLAESFGLDAAGGRTPQGDAFIATDWGSRENTGHALPGSMLPFVQLVLGEAPSLPIQCPVDPRWYPEQPFYFTTPSGAPTSRGDASRLRHGSLEQSMLRGMSEGEIATTSERVRLLQERDDAEALRLLKQYENVDFSTAEEDGAQISL